MITQWCSRCGPSATATWAARTQVVCKLIPGGVAMAITAGQAARLLESAAPSGPVEMARCELAAELLGDLRRIDSQMAVVTQICYGRAYYERKLTEGKTPKEALRALKRRQ
jgi:hypothetical protein